MPILIRVATNTTTLPSESAGLITFTSYITINYPFPNTLLLTLLRHPSPISPNLCFNTSHLANLNPLLPTPASSPSPVSTSTSVTSIPKSTNPACAIHSSTVDNNSFPPPSPFTPASSLCFVSTTARSSHSVASGSGKRAG